MYSFIILIIIEAPWFWFLIMPFAIIFAGLLYVSIYVTYCSLCFYIKRGDALASTMEETLVIASNYPPVIYSNAVKIFFVTLLPVFFYAFIPAQYLFLTFNIWWVLGLIFVISLWVTLTFVLFNRGLRKYNSDSLMGGRL